MSPEHSPDRRSIPALCERMLYDELSHRIVNELACAQALLRGHRRSCAVAGAVTALDDAIEQLHGFARLQALLARPEPCGRLDLAAGVIELSELMTATRLANARVAVSVSADDVVTSGDAAWLLNLALSELITNAHKHAFRAQGGSLQIRLRALGDQAVLTVADRSYALEELADSGCTGGTRRGYAIVEELVRALGGRMWSRRSPRGGAVSIAFPI